MTRTLLVLASTLIVFSVTPVRAVELKLENVLDRKGDGPDGKGNTADDTWQFWFELVHKRGQFMPLDTWSADLPKAGVPRKVRGPIAGMLPNPDDTLGWIFHRDWDGRFEGVWADRKARQIIAYPYVEKTAHCAVAITYRIPADGKYDISGGVTDLQVAPDFPQHDGIDWIIEIAQGGALVRKIGSGGPIGDGKGRPDSGTFRHSGIEAKKGQLVRLVIHPRKWWGSDMTRIDSFKIEPTPVGVSSARPERRPGDCISFRTPQPATHRFEGGGHVGAGHFRNLLAVRERMHLNCQHPAGGKMPFEIARQGQQVGGIRKMAEDAAGCAWLDDRQRERSGKVFLACIDKKDALGVLEVVH